MTFRKTKLALLLAALGTGSAAYSAEETTLPQIDVRGQSERADGPVDGYRATRSATFTKTDTLLQEVPASVTVVPAQLIKDQSMQSIADVLRYVPGTHGAQGEGNRDQVILRGNNTTADFYVDGIRDDAQVFRDLYNLERVEVLKGAGGMTFGRGGAGGLVNRVTKKPVFVRVGEASLTLDSHQKQRGTLDVGNKINDAAAWRLNVMGEKADSFRSGVDMERYAINPTLTLVPNNGTTLTLGIESAHDERTADRGLPSQNGRPFKVDPSTFFGNANQSKARSTVNGAYAILDHDFGGGVQLKNNFRATHYDKFYQNVYANGSVTNDDLVKIEAYNNTDKRTNIFNQTDLTTKFNTSGIEHTLLVGLELGRQDSTSVRQIGFFNGAATFVNVVAASPFAVSSGFRPNGSSANNSVKSDVAAVYIQDQIAFSKQWKLLAGLRYDYFKVDFNDRRTLVAPTDLTRTDREWSPRLGLIWTPNDWSSYYTSYSYAFLPSGEQLSLAPNTADLKPESAKNYEIGARWDLLPKLALSAAVFRLDRDGVRSSDPLNPGFFVKTGQQRTEGIELGLQGDITRNWQIFASYAKLDGRITKTTSAAAAGQKIQLVPEHTLSVWNKLALGGGWSAGLGLVYQSESFTSFDNTVTLPSFTRADGAIYYAFADGKTRVALNVENLSDKKYYPTAHNNNNISPGAPRNFRLTLATAF